MQAAMSKDLKKILNDPEAKKQLENSLSKLSSHKEAVIFLGDKKYHAKFVGSESQK